MMKYSLPLLVWLVLLTWPLTISPVGAAASAQVQNDSHYTDSLGFYNIVGEVLNTGDISLRFIAVTATLRDAGGQVLDVRRSYVLADYLPPNEKAPFHVVETDATKSAQTTSYTLALEFQESPTPYEKALLLQGVTSSKNILGYLEVVGEVRNNGMQTSTFTRVVGTFYDAAGKVVYVGFTFTSPTDIPSGQAYGFKLTVGNSEISNRIQNYALFAESQEYTSIPESSWPVLIAVAALTLALAVRRRRLL